MNSCAEWNQNHTSPYLCLGVSWSPNVFGPLGQNGGTQCFLKYRTNQNTLRSAPGVDNAVIKASNSSSGTSSTSSGVVATGESGVSKGGEMGGLSNGAIGGIIGGVVGGIAVLILVFLRIYLSRVKRRRIQFAEQPKGSVEPGEQYDQRVQRADNQDETALSVRGNIVDLRNQHQDQ